MFRGIFIILVVTGSGYLVWYLGIGRTVKHNCPEQQLTPNQVESLYSDAQETLKINQLGEYHASDSISKSVPMFERAARHGHRKAMDRLASLFIGAGVVEMVGIDGHSQLVTAEIGMMWSILGVHLGDAVKSNDQATYQILLDPKIPFPDDFFRQSSGVAWMFQMMTRTHLQRAREQAYAWRQCWPREP